MKPFVVVGTGHSGTGWAAALFTALGYECGHERWHNTGPYTGMPTADSSWLAVPRLHLVDGPVLHLVRDPLAVVRSFMRSGTYRDVDTTCPYTRWTYEQLPDLWSAADELGRCIIRTTRWDARIPLNSPGKHTLRIEDAAPHRPDAARRVGDAVWAMTGDRLPEQQIQAVLENLGTRRNTHAPGVQCGLSWEDVMEQSPEGGRELAARANIFNYPNPIWPTRVLS